MGNAKVVDVAFLKIIRRQLDEVLAGCYSPGSILREKLDSVRHKMDLVMSIAPDAPLELVPGMTKSDICKAMELETWDPALPISWVRHVQVKTGFNVVPHFVYGYDEKGPHGRPVPITAIGRAMLPVINHVMDTSYPTED